MKPIAIFVLVAAVSLAAVAASAKTVTTQTSTNDRMVAGVAGPITAANTSQKKMKAQAKKAQPAPTDDQLRTGASTSHPYTSD